MDNLPVAAQEYLEGHRLDEVECVVADLPGIARGKAVAREIGGSTIQTKPPLSDKLTREFKRAAYRAKLHLHPQRPLP